jgi:hypothetical protein
MISKTGKAVVMAGVPAAAKVKARVVERIDIQFRDGVGGD